MVVGAVSSLFVVASNVVGRCTFLFLYDEVRLIVDILVNKWVLTDILEDLNSLVVFPLPSRHVVVGRFVLQPLQDHLVLTGYLHQISFALVSVKATSISNACALLECHRLHIAMD